MNYIETLPDDIFTHHIESYWCIQSMKPSDGIEMFLPTCTFNILFTNRPLLIRSKNDFDWKCLQPGANFFGQTNTSVIIKSDLPFRFYGIRFKPFAFSRIIHRPVYLFNDDFIPLQNILDLHPTTKTLINEITTSKDGSQAFHLMNELIHDLLKDQSSIDEQLRAQLNYIMDRKGSIKVSDLFTEFAVSKVTLHKHFINKVGLSPKKVAQIWRMNYILQMKAENPKKSLTSLCLEAGFYDQAHFIKDFRQLFSMSPRKFFSENSEALQIAHQNISKRFTNQYDPK